MAESTTRSVGNDELVYVATTAPTVPSSKDDAAYDIVGLQTSFNYQVQGQEVQIRDKRGSAIKYGANTRSATLGVNTSLTADDGQTIMDNAAESESPKTTVYVLITSGVNGDRFRHFTAEVGGLNDQSPTDAAATVEYSIGVTGAVTKGTLSS